MSRTTGPAGVAKYRPTILKKKKEERGQNASVRWAHSTEKRETGILHRSFQRRRINVPNIQRMAGAGRASPTKQSIWAVSPEMTVMGSSLGLSEICGKAVTKNNIKNKVQRTMECVVQIPIYTENGDIGGGADGRRSAGPAEEDAASPRSVFGLCNSRLQ